MKWILIFLAFFLFLPLSNSQSTIEAIPLFAIKIKLMDNKIQKGYLMNLNEKEITFFSKKKQLKQNLLNNCIHCQTVALDEVEKLIVLGTKNHTGKIIGGSLALMITTIAALNPRGDGLGSKETAAIYGTYYGGIAIGAGALIDLLNNNSKSADISKGKTILKHKDKVTFDAFSSFIEHSPIAIFEQIQQQQSLELEKIIEEIKANPFMHQQRISFFQQDSPVVSGYLIGQDNNGHLLVTNNLLQIVEERESPPQGLKKVKVSNIFYYQID